MKISQKVFELQSGHDFVTEIFFVAEIFFLWQTDGQDKNNRPSNPTGGDIIKVTEREEGLYGPSYYGPRQANLVLIAYASSEGSGELAHPRSLARTSAARPYKQWVKRNRQTENQIPGPSEWLGMRG